MPYSSPPLPSATTDHPVASLTANDRFKSAFDRYVWGSIVAAVGLHFAILYFAPALKTENWEPPVSDLPLEDLLLKTKLPEAPEQIQRPAVPVVSQVDISTDITMAPNTFDNYVPDAAPPPPSIETDEEEREAFVPYTQGPEVLNAAEVERALQREYPQMLKQSGIGGTVWLELLVDETGAIRDERITRSSGYESMDQAALKVSEIMRLTPAMNREQPVTVWVSFPITFVPR